MNSGLYPVRTVRLNRPRSKPGDKSVQLGATVPASLKVTVLREADAEGVSLSHVVYAALMRQCALSYDAREKGLLPIPGRLSDSEIDLCAVAAQRMGVSVERWIAHALLDAAAKASPENITADSATREEALTGEETKAAA